MDEILIANFMLFLDVVPEGNYDLWIGDEAWELDYFLHENPELKSAAYVWLTDFVGWLPMDDGGEHEAFLTTDYNAEMIEHIARFPRIRDRAVFIGNPDDVVPDSFGTACRGSATGRSSTTTSPATDRLRARRRPREAAGRAGIRAAGEGLHRYRGRFGRWRASTAAGDRLVPAGKALVPELRMIVVAGPRIDPASLPQPDGLEFRAYVHELYRHLAACDLAVVQGGLTTSMELTANVRPFLYFPLRHHFEQNFHVRHRLERYGAGRRMDFETRRPGRSRPRSPRRSGERSTTARSSPTAPRVRPRSSPSCCSVPVVSAQCPAGCHRSRHPAKVRYLTFTQPYMSNSAKCGVKLHRTR